MRDSIELPSSPFTRKDALAQGVSARELRDLCRRGVIRRLLHGVYADALAADSLQTRCAAVTTVTPEGAAICDRTAAWIWGVDALAFWELDRPLPVEMVVAPGASPPRRSNVSSGERALVPSDVETLNGLVVTTAVRTALDLGCKLRRHHALASIDALMRIGGFTPEVMRAELARFRRRRGVIQLRELIDLADPLAESPGESWTRLAILDAGFPRPVAQYWVDEDGVRVFRLDLAYPKLRICIEFDGRDFHSSPVDKERDEARRAWLRARGWVVVVVRAADLQADRRGAWLSALGRAMNDRQRTTFRGGRYDVPRESGSRLH